MLIESKTKLFTQALQYIIYGMFCDSTYLQCTSLLKEAWQITKAIIAFLIISFLDFSRKGKEEGASSTPCREKKYYILLLTSIIPLLQSFAVISLSTELPYILKGMICLYSSTICSNMHLILISAVTLPQTMFLVLAGCTSYYIYSTYLVLYILTHNAEIVVDCKVLMIKCMHFFNCIDYINQQNI